MSAHVKPAPWRHRSALHIIAAPVARLLRRPKAERALPYDWREIERLRIETERLRIETELLRAHVALVTRFKIM